MRMEGKAKILIVDDDVDFIESIKTILDAKPYNVIIANQGDEGLQKAREENPNLILLDVIMPVKDGFTAAEQLNKDPELFRIPIIVLTGFSARVGETSIPRSRGYTLETEDYIEKPVRPQDLLAAVEKALKRASS